MQYLLPILIEKLGAVDLEGTAGLPDVMKPSPSQKPMVMKSTPEKCEEIRLRIAELMRILISTTEETSLRGYVDDIVNIVRALAMDPYGPVIMEACGAISELSKNAKETIFHYAEALGRSLFTSLVHKHSKNRIAGLEALGQLMYVAPFKYSSNIIDGLIGFRDPNVVPIKDFYQPSTNVHIQH